MRNLVISIAVTVGVLITLMGINVICNMNGVELDSTVTGTCSAVVAMFLYEKMVTKKKTCN